MKKIIFLVAGCFLVGSMAYASENPFFSETNGRNGHYTYMMGEPIQFMERGILFYVFTNGDFDFNTRPHQNHTTYVYRRGNSAMANVPQNIGVRIEQDAFGRIRRVGNTFINYDQNHRVTRIGNVFMRYNRNGLSQVGGMLITYNRIGHIIGFHGHINAHNPRPHINPVTTYYGPGFSTGNYYQGTSNTHNSNTGNTYYYYREDGTREAVDNKK